MKSCSKMEQKPNWIVFALVILIINVVSSEDGDVIKALSDFMDQLSAGDSQRNASWGWNTSSDPCTDKWLGVTCDSTNVTVRKIVLDELDFVGTLSFDSLCETKSLAVLSLKGNQIVGKISDSVSSCSSFTHVYLSGNRLSGDLPDSLSQLNNLRRLDISQNDFSGVLPNLPRILRLLSFLAQDNQFSGRVPEFDFSILVEFNVSNNNFSGPVPDVGTRFGESSFLGNPELCGKPLPNSCPAKKSSKGTPKKQYFIYTGYAALGLAFVLLVAYKCVTKRKTNTEIAAGKPKSSKGNNSDKASSVSIPSKSSNNRSEFSITSVESGMAAVSSLVVLTSPVAKGLRFEELLRAPAELLGKGKHGSIYKVTVASGANLAVKRIKDWAISADNFKKRMQTIDQASHPNVLPLVAFYCSKQEKLLVYEYQPNGSLFNHLHGSQNGQKFDWGSRLHTATSIAEGLAYMHEQFNKDRIAHGNLKSTNIILNKDMEPCISEYGLMMSDDSQQEEPKKSLPNSFKYDSPNNSHYSFKIDVYNFGVILLELLTGKPVGNNGFDLARWVHSVVREEWTDEVLDRALVAGGGSEERMVNLLQVALKCIDPNPHVRPVMSKVAGMLKTLKEEDEMSISVEVSNA